MVLCLCKKAFIFVVGICYGVYSGISSTGGRLWAAFAFISASHDAPQGYYSIKVTLVDGGIPLGEYWIDVEVVNQTTGQIEVTYTGDTMLTVGDKFTLSKEDFILKNTAGEILTCTFNPKFVVLSKKDAQSLGYGAFCTVNQITAFEAKYATFTINIMNNGVLLCSTDVEFFVTD